MNNDNNNLNNGQNVTTPSVNNNQIPTTPVANKFMAVSDVNQINQPNDTVTTTPAVEPQVVQTPTVEPQVVQTPAVETQPVQTPTVETQPVQTPVADTSQTTAVPTVQQPVDNNAIVNENLKKVEIKNYTPPSKFKVFVLFVFFAMLIAFVIFLPDISSMVRIYLNGKEEPQVQVITTGKLICSLSTNTSDLDKEYEFEYGFTDNKLKTIKYIVNTRGDTTTENTLDELSEECKKLKEYTDSIEAVNVKCEYTEGKLMEKQVFELETLDVETLDAHYTEAGGITLSAKYDQEIDGIESNMKASGYTCERQR